MSALVELGPRDVITVAPGPVLLAALSDGPSLLAHRREHPELPRLSAADLVGLTLVAHTRGRGGAGFPFAMKLQTAARGNRVAVVVNLAEGEPASAKDAALATLRPHLVLDGAALSAAALGTREAHVVLPGHRPAVGAAVRRAVAERTAAGERVRWQVHTAGPGFVAGQARAVVELLAGRDNLPVTAWEPEAVRGLRGRPTLLSNGETWAHVAALAHLGPDRYCAHGTEDEPGTTLLTLRGDGPRPTVREVRFGTPWAALLKPAELDGPVLIGGYHGTWAAPGELAALTVSRERLGGAGLALGAGVVLPLAPGDCPVRRTGAILGYLASQSAGRCGPCRHGLPALAAALPDGAGLRADPDRLLDVAAQVAGRGACAHPDGTVRLVRTLLDRYADEVIAHTRGCCGFERAAPASRFAGAPRGMAGQGSAR